MSDDELERLRRRRLSQLGNRFLTSKREKKVQISKTDLLNKVFVDRGWEVFRAAQNQYPQVAKRLGGVLIQLVSSGRVKQVSGPELYYLLKKMGFRVKLKTTIKISEHGKLKSIEEKMKE